MPRSKSISGSMAPYYDTPASPSHSNAPSSSASQSTKTLKKTSSFADLAKRQLKKFKSRGDFDFGCQGDGSSQDISEEQEEEELEARANLTRKAPPFPSSPSSPSVSQLPSSSSPLGSPPSRPLAPFEVLDESHFTASQLRSLQRQKEEALAASACLEYISSHRRHSRKRSSIHGISLPTLDRLNLHDRDPTATYESSRPRSDSSSSSLCSSRPRTNDSLPSFASSDAPTCSSSGSYPPSPVQQSRPTFSRNGSMSSKKVDLSETANQPRAYAFI